MVLGVLGRWVVALALVEIVFQPPNESIHRPQVADENHLTYTSSHEIDVQCYAARWYPIGH